jgi:regulator of protease activity HflC (stomatin/prohibitin superfamily)
MLVVLGIIAVLAGLALRATQRVGVTAPATRLSVPLIFGGIALAILGVITSTAVQVPAGHRGVVTLFGRVEDRVLGEGINIVIPFAERVILVDVRVHAHNFREIQAASQEYQDVSLTGTMNFHLDPANVNDLYQTVGLDFADKILDPAFNDFIKEVVPSYQIVEILAKRDEIRRKAIDKLSENLTRYHIIVDDIYIANIAFSRQYTQAIEYKQTQQQRVETERQILAQREIQAQQQVAQARGEADAAVVRAIGQSEANRLLDASLSPNIIQWNYVQKLTDKVQVMLLPSGQQFLFDIGGLVGTSQAP